MGLVLEESVLHNILPENRIHVLLKSTLGWIAWQFLNSPSRTTTFKVLAVPILPDHFTSHIISNIIIELWILWILITNNNVLLLVYEIAEKAFRFSQVRLVSARCSTWLHCCQITVTREDLRLMANWNMKTQILPHPPCKYLHLRTNTVCYFMLWMMRFLSTCMIELSAENMVMKNT